MDAFELAKSIKESIVSTWNFFASLNWQEILATTKTIFAIVSFILFFGIIYLIIKLNFISKGKKPGGVFVSPARSQKKLVKKWERIEKRLKSPQEAETKLAIIEADKFFDDILKRCGYSGKDMGGRLKKVNSSQVSNIDDIWKAHKVRNNIVHDTDYRLTEFEAENSVRAYKKALEELEVL